MSDQDHADLGAQAFLLLANEHSTSAAQRNPWGEISFW